jgi:hypothetical protein
MHDTMLITILTFVAVAFTGCLSFACYSRAFWVARDDIMRSSLWFIIATLIGAFGWFVMGAVGAAAMSSGLV